MHEIFPETARVNEHDHLDLGGIDTVELAERFGTPLMLFDRATFEARARSFGSVLEPSNVFYAAKALCCVAVCELVDSLGLGLDICTGGELATARAASFPMERVVFHGNNKSIDEINSARDANVGRIVLDSFEEIERVERGGAWGKLLVRATPGVEAHTHEFVQTGQEDSKFGFSLANGIALDAIRRANVMSGSSLVGIHAHIGSQIFELTAFDLAIQRLADLLVTANQDLGFEASELNLGGGLGVAHTGDEMTPHPAESTRRVLDSTRREFDRRGLTVPSLHLEPGRALVGSSMVTLYRVGTVKRIPGVRTYVSVDGGMSDNIRPALYGARYEAFLANRMSAEPGPRVTVAGKHCESGDVLIKDVHLPGDVAAGDLLSIPATGAYTYSMASNYNRVPRPPIVMVARGNATEVVGRESNDDLLHLDRHLNGSRLSS
jgi:diaminopimelate decarboxylase